MVKYTYDAWGNHTITDYTEFGLGSINPFRYRSYYYDTETGLYYLKSRYYDPQTGRFINIDDISYLDPETIGGANLYTYCLNNPIKYVDPSGNSVIMSLICASIFLGISAFISDVKTQLKNNGVDFDGVDWGRAINVGIVEAGLGFAFAVGVYYLGPVLAAAEGAKWGTMMIMAGVSTAVSFGAGALGYAAEEWFNKRNPTLKNVLIQGCFVATEGLVNFVFGGTVGSIGKVGSSDEDWKKIFEYIFIKPLVNIYDFLRDYFLSR